MGVLEEIGRRMPPGTKSARECASAFYFYFFTCSEVDSNAIWAVKCC